MRRHQRFKRILTALDKAERVARQWWQAGRGLRLPLPPGVGIWKGKERASG